MCSASESETNRPIEKTRYLRCKWALLPRTPSLTCDLLSK